MRTAVFEVQTRAGHQIFDGAGDQRCAGVCYLCDARADVHRHACNLVTMELYLAGVQASADLDSYLACSLLDAQCAADSTRRAVECCEKTIARNIHLPATERCKLTSYDGMMAIETFFPCLVADAGHALRGAHNVGKQHR